MGSKTFRTVYDFLRNDVLVGVRCLGCQHVGRMEAREMVERFGPREPIGRAAKRFKCSHCGHKGAQLTAFPRL